MTKQPETQRTKQGEVSQEPEYLHMNPHQARNSHVAIASATIAHVLGWAAFLWLVLGPARVSFSDVNAYRSLIALFVPVVVTGLVLMFLLTRTVRRGANAVVVWGLTAVLLAFCGLGYLSFGVLYLPAAIALIVTAVAFGRGRGLPGLNDQ